MKQQEKTQRTQEKILKAAICEFGDKGYDAASINTVCQESQVSKGLLYHNFKSKDDLFLQCVDQCYRELTDYLTLNDSPPLSGLESLQRLLELRQAFFGEHQNYASLFFQSLLQPPHHLHNELDEIRKDFSDFCSNTYRKALKNMTLREGVTEEIALQYFSVFMEMFNGYFQSRASQGEDFESLLEVHEQSLGRILDLILYGLVKQNEGREMNHDHGIA